MTGFRPVTASGVDLGVGGLKVNRSDCLKTSSLPNDEALTIHEAHSYFLY